MRWRLKVRVEVQGVWRGRRRRMEEMEGRVEGGGERWKGMGWRRVKG